MAAIKTEDLTRIYQVGGEEVRALDGLTVSLERGSLAAVWSAPVVLVNQL